MKQRTEEAPELTPGGWLLLGPLFGAVAGGGLWQVLGTLRTQLAPPWTDLLLPPVLLGQGIFLALLVVLLIEAWNLHRFRGVATLLSEDEESWAGWTRSLALTKHHPRPRGDQRCRSLQGWRQRLERQVLGRWLVYALFALTPAFLGLAVGLNGVAINKGRPVPWLDLFLPLLVGTGEGLLLGLLLGLILRRNVRLLDLWLKRCLELEQPPAPVPVVVAASAPPADTAPPKRMGLRPVGAPPRLEESPVVSFEAPGDSSGEAGQ